MPRYLSLFKYTPEGRKGFMKEKAAAREAALKLTIESAGGKLELFNWTVPGSDYSGVTIAEAQIKSAAWEPFRLPASLAARFGNLSDAGGASNRRNATRAKKTPSEGIG
jgi:uncharacterized protein with GYD domain